MGARSNGKSRDHLEIMFQLGQRHGYWDVTSWIACRSLFWIYELIFARFFLAATANAHDINERALKPEVTWPTGNHFSVRPKVRLLEYHVQNTLSCSVLYIWLDICAFLHAETANAHVINERALKPEVTWPTGNHFSVRTKVRPLEYHVQNSLPCSIMCILLDICAFFACGNGKRACY